MSDAAMSDSVKRIPRAFCIFSGIVYIFEPILSLGGNSYKSAKYHESDVMLVENAISM